MNYWGQTKPMQVIDWTLWHRKFSCFPLFGKFLLCIGALVQRLIDAPLGSYLYDKMRKPHMSRGLFALRFHCFGNLMYGVNTRSAKNLKAVMLEDARKLAPEAQP